MDYTNTQTPASNAALAGNGLSLSSAVKLELALRAERISMETPVFLQEASKESKPAGKKMGVWVDGKLRLQSRDRDAIEEYAARRMREKHTVWVAPVGSFVDVPKGGE
jgi:hypothetical protein